MPESIPGNNPAGNADPQWFAGFDDTTKSHMVAKGYDKLDAPAAFLAAHEAYKGAESKLGIPADRVLKIPDATDSEAWKGVWSKLGAPGDPAGYDFSTVKDATGKGLPDGTASWLREQAAKLNMTKDAAVGLATAMLGRDTAESATQQQQNTVLVAAEQADLDAAWGGNKVRNEFLAQRTWALLGKPMAEFEAMKQRPGFAAEMKGLVNIATRLGEADLVGAGAGNGGGGGPGNSARQLSPDEAIARLDDIKQGRDKDFGRRYHHGTAAEKAAAVAEWRAVTELATRARMSGVR